MDSLFVGIDYGISPDGRVQVAPDSRVKVARRAGLKSALKCRQASPTTLHLTAGFAGG